MKFVLFDKSAVHFLATTSDFQSVEYSLGELLIDILLENKRATQLPNIRLVYDAKGIFFIGGEKADEILVIDLTCCELLRIEKNSPNNLLVVLQKMFRAAIHFWNRQPFTNAERVNNSKLVVFPFPYNYNTQAPNKRLVLEREPKSKRLVKRGIHSPLLVYKYNDETMPYGSEEVADVGVLDDAGEAYLKIRPSVEFGNKDKEKDSLESNWRLREIDLSKKVENMGFRYLSYDLQYEKLTKKQQSIVDYPSTNSPLRIVGSAGTGKTTSMLLRAYRLLRTSKERGNPLKIAFFTHSESTRFETEEAFKQLDFNSEFLCAKDGQSIMFQTLFAFCKDFRHINEIQVADSDASDAKEYQLLLIEDAFAKVQKEEYKKYKPYLSEKLKFLLESTNEYYIAMMLQHEFSIQIKGRADGIFDKYKEIESIKNGLPVDADDSYKDKAYIYRVFQVYQTQLAEQSVYDVDDIIIEALLGLNAPIWRRSRIEKGYDYIFVDEMHLFNANEQFAFHYLTKDINQEKIPICFAIDYSQTIGDRGELSDNYIEKELSGDGAFECETVMRSTPHIVDLCASIIASGTLIFRSEFKNPYKTSIQNSFPYDDGKRDKIPQLLMYRDEEAMLMGLKTVCDKIISELTCKNHQVAIISFEDKYLNADFVAQLEQKLSRSIYLLNGRNATGISREVKSKDKLIFTSPYNINGLEFDAVILLGVDGKRVPPTEGVADIAKNYLKYKAYNMLYLSCSRAKYRIAMVGNEQNAISECLSHSLECGTLSQEDCEA